MVVVQESTDASTPVDLGGQVLWWGRPFEQLVVEPLVLSLAMVVLEVLVNHQVQVALTPWGANNRPSD
jgi:hypothetical protein